jgi:hypothetical protein
MRSKLLQIVLLIIALSWMVQSGLMAAENPGTAGQGSGSEDNKYPTVGSVKKVGEGNHAVTASSIKSLAQPVSQDPDGTGADGRD